MTAPVTAFNRAWHGRPGFSTLPTRLVSPSETGRFFFGGWLAVRWGGAYDASSVASPLAPPSLVDEVSLPAPSSEPEAERPFESFP